jgi:predicted transcriptional regulator
VERHNIYFFYKPINLLHRTGEDVKTCCEVVVSDFLPALRALIAKELIQTYNFTQQEVAKKLKITQPAVSYYLHELRGTKVKSLSTKDEIVSWVKSFAAQIASDQAKPINLLSFCKELQKKNLLPAELEKCSFCSE